MFMKLSLLTTKLQIPPQPLHVVRRARLIDAIEHNIPHYKLIQISAPAGYGKTTLLAQWAHSSRFPVAWLSLSEEDNDLDRFLRYLLAVWQEVQPGVRESPLALLLGSWLPDSEAALSAFINIANDASNYAVFVLDDYHLIEDPTIHQALTFLLDHLPPTLHFVLVGRAEPPLPLARYRARYELLEFRAEELQFLLEETADFLSQMRLELSYDEVVTLQTQLEGWIAGLQLVVLSLQRRLAGADKLVVTGKHRFIADYLGEDVLAPLPDNLRHFLLQTSILDRLCGSLCDAIIEGQDSHDMLQRLERENLFLMPLDDSREWYRYHWLFADFLQEELKRRQPDRVAQLHRRAARWYLTHDLPEQAFDHALDGDDVELTVKIFDRYLNAKLLGGEFRVVKRWLDSMPAAWVAAYPVLDLGRAGFLAYTGAFEACIRCINGVEQRLQSAEKEDVRWQLARVTAVRCFIACAQNDLGQAEALADQALRDLPHEDLGFRPAIYAALGDSYRQNARWEEAKACYLEALNFTHVPAIRAQSAHIFGALADLDLRQGRLRNAASYWSKAMTAIQKRENLGHLPLPVIGWLYTRLSEILYEWNELEEAWKHLLQGLERAELGGDPRALIAGYLLASRLKLTQGDDEGAAEYLERARPLMEQASFVEWVSRFQHCQLELWLAQDRLRTAVAWADEMLQSGELEERPESEVAQLALVRVLIVKGDTPSLEQASVHLARLLQAAEAEGRMGILIRALALQALADWRRGNSTGAMTSLERALRLAEPEGYVRLFADLGLSMARLLQEARTRTVMPGYISTLLAACGVDSSTDSLSVPLPEPLTPREQEVLELLAAGLTNREIGEKLVVSPQTVKKHTGNIYGKLGVGNRTEAVGRARELDLLA
jgi:LuxR family maltose regulon positive regulatory protein